MTALVDRALAAAGLGGAWDARRGGRLSDEWMAKLRAADLLALGALADRIRRQEVGEEVRVYIGEASDEPSVTLLPSRGATLTGLELLREVAVSRIASGPRARIRIDWSRCGMELAQVALGFGANELSGPITSKAGLPLAPDELLGVGKKSRWESARVVKQRELADCVRRAGRVPVVVGAEGVADPPAATQEAP